MTQSLTLLSIVPELALTATVVLVMLVDLFMPGRSHRNTEIAALLGVATSVYATLGYTQTLHGTFFSGHYLVDNLSQWTKAAILGLALFYIPVVRNRVTKEKSKSGECIMLALFSILGMMSMVSSNSLLMLYMSLEMLSLPLYAMVALSARNRTSEAAMKYFIMGALASGLLLYGFSLIYGASGSILLPEIFPQIRTLIYDPGLDLMTGLGVMFVLVALAFKFGAVPFHMWLPDVYEGSPTAVVMLIGSLPKIAAFVFMLRIVELLPNTNTQWQLMLMILAVLSLVFGNLAALMQTNVKRLLAYSTIGHVGFIMLGFMVLKEGTVATLFYVTTYAITALAGFGILTNLQTENEVLGVRELKGLATTHPQQAFLLLLVFFSLAGIPPLVGFYAKFLILKSVVASGYVWLAVLAIFMSVVAAFYYLKLIRAMYFDEPVHMARFYDDGTLSLTMASVLALATLALGIVPAGLLTLCQQALA